jgi:hypothetical protein
MVGIYNKVNKFGENVWSGVNNFGVPLLQTIAPMFGDKGKAVGDAITTGIGTTDYLGNAFSQLSKQNPKPAEPQDRDRKIPSALNQKINDF